VYGSLYEEGKQAFIDELYLVLVSWQGPTLIGGDFNLVRFAYEKSNGNINHKWVDAFNEWVSRWSLMELDAPNKMFTWTNNQENLGMAKLDRVFITTEWEAAFPLARVKALKRPPSDHNPILLNMGDNVHFGKKISL
jgi:endonuclease/exonuclease/phosphatase family metal-dependent hydrolase